MWYVYHGYLQDMKLVRDPNINGNITQEKKKGTISYIAGTKTFKEDGKFIHISDGVVG